MPEILLIIQQYCWQHCLQYCWFSIIAGNIVVNIADYLAILQTTLLISNIAGYIDVNNAGNIDDWALMLEIWLAILLVIQQYCQQYWIRLMFMIWTNPVIIRKHPVILEINPVIFGTNLVIFMTNPVLFRTSSIWFISYP